MTSPGDLPRFVPLEHVMEELSIPHSQALALVRSGQLRVIKLGGRVRGSGESRWTPSRITSPSARRRLWRWFAQNRQAPREPLVPPIPETATPVRIAQERSDCFTSPSRRRNNLCPSAQDIDCWTAPGLSWYREALGSEWRGAGSGILGDLRPISRQVCLDRAVAEGVQPRAAVDQTASRIQPLGEHPDLR